MFDFNRQRVIVTGAGGALGTAVVRAFAGAGARVALVDINQRALCRVVDSLAGVQATLSIETDLTDPPSVQSMADQVSDRFGGVDVLANIAGGFTMGPRVHETELADWHAMLDLNAKSVFLCCRAVIPHMLVGGGKIVNVAARVAIEGRAKMAAYSVSKSAVARLTESLAAEYRSEGINVNCIMPGTIDTPANRRDMPKADHSRWVSPAALADVILFLASDGARAVHGASLPVYGLT